MCPLMGPFGTHWWVKLIFEILFPNHSPHNKLAYYWEARELKIETPCNVPGAPESNVGLT